MSSIIIYYDSVDVAPPALPGTTRRSAPATARTAAAMRRTLLTYTILYYTILSTTTTSY